MRALLPLGISAYSNTFTRLRPLLSC